MSSASCSIYVRYIRDTTSKESADRLQLTALALGHAEIRV